MPKLPKGMFRRKGRPGWYVRLFRNGRERWQSLGTDFAKRLDVETIQVSLGHAYPGTEFYDHAKKNGLVTIENMTDESGHQLPNVVYP